MYNYAANASLFDGVSNIYVLSTATVFLAVIIALYCANFLKDFGKTTNTDDNSQEKENIEGEDVQTENTEQGIDAFSIGTKHRNGSTENKKDLEDYDDDETSALQSDGLVSKLKSARLRELEAQLTQQQLEEERRIEREQLSAIFELLKKQETDLNMKEIDESELSAQLHLYR